MEFDENGNAKQQPVFRDVEETVKGKHFWNKDKKITKQVPSGNQPVFKEGKTMEGYQAAMKELMDSQHDIVNKPKVWSKLPIVTY